MSNGDNDDLEDLDLDEFDDSGFDDYSEKGTLADLWKNNPMVKVGVILAAFVLIVAGVILFGGRGTDVPVSRMSISSDVSEAPGSAEVTPAFQEAIEEENQRRTEEALQMNQSAVPMPVEPPKGTIPLQVDQEPEEDPLERWRRMQEDRIRQQQVQAQNREDPQPEPEIDNRTPAINALSQAMSIQMESVLQNQGIPPTHYKKITDMQYLDNIADKKRKAEEERRARLLENLPEPETVETILIPPGTIEYAQLLTEANTDAPGAILAQIASGPLKGARVIGSFESTRNYLTLNFSSVTHKGLTQGIEAIAIDPDTTLPGVITEIDRRYTSRILLPMAAEFVEGLSEAISESGRTTVTITGETVSESKSDANTDQEVASGVTEAGKAAADLLTEEADSIQPMLRVASGTAIGILFLAPVLENPPAGSSGRTVEGQ